MLELPEASGWRDFVSGRAEYSLDRARAIDTQLKDGTQRTSAQVIDLLNESDVALRNAETFVSLLAEVHPDDAVRSLAEDRLQLASIYRTERGQDAELYAVLAAVAPTDLDADESRLLVHTLRDFRRSGIDQDEATRKRLKQIAERLTVLGQEFSRNTRDDVRSIRIAPERLAGLAQDYIDAHPADEDGLVTITTDYPDAIPFRTFAADARGAPRTAGRSSSTGRGPPTTFYCARSWRCEPSRRRLLGYASWPDYDAEVKMIGTGKAIADFVDQIADAGRTDGAQRGRDVARTSAARPPGAVRARPRPTRPTTPN